jgi:hypothetical protein
VVKASHAGQADHFGLLRRSFLDGAAFRSVTDRGVHPLAVVVLDVLAKQASQMVLADHDHVIEQFPSHASDEALGGPVLSGALKDRPLGRSPSLEIETATSGEKIASLSKIKCR